MLEEEKASKAQEPAPKQEAPAPKPEAKPLEENKAPRPPTPNRTSQPILLGFLDQSCLQCRIV